MKKIISVLLGAFLIATVMTTFSFASTLPVINTAAIISDKANWTGTFLDPTTVGETVFTADSISLGGKHIKSAGYLGAKYQNFQFAYKLKITWPEDGYDWGSIVTFRDQDTGIHVWEQGRKETYGVFYNLSSDVDDMTKAGTISISKWNQPVTHKGDPENLGEAAACVNLDLNGKEHVYNLMVEDVSNGVHINLYMDGKKIIDYTDTSANPIKKEGGIMVLQDAPRTVLFSAVKSGEQPVLEGESSSTTSSSKSISSSKTSSTVSTSLSSGGASNVLSDESISSVSDYSEIQSSMDTSSLEHKSDISSNASSETTDDNTPANNTLLIIIIAVVIILGAGTATALVILKNKK